MKALRLIWRVALVTIVASTALAAQATPPAPTPRDVLQRAYDFERRGQTQAAADAFRQYLAARPTEVAALLGLERALETLGRVREIVPQVRAAVAAAPDNPALYSVAVRAYAAADQPDSVRAAAERWAKLEPEADTPYREWGTALLQRRDRSGAKAAFLLGRQRLNRPDALAGEMAQLAIADGDYLAAVKEWLLAMRRLPGYRASALTTLGAAPEAQRPELLKQIDAQSDPDARRLGAELRVRWGDAMGGLAALEATLPQDKGAAIEALRGFLEQLRVQTGTDARRASGKTLEAIADRASPMQAPRLRLEAAQAYMDGGDRTNARRVLDQLANDGTIPPDVSSGAAMAAIGVLIDEGKVEEAQRRLASYREQASADEYAALLRRIALGWARAGKFKLADSVLHADSTVEGFALAGRVRLYQGDIAGAVSLFQAAGPYAGTREETTERTALVALLQPIEADSMPALGAAILALDTGDTTAALKGLETLAPSLPLEKGGAEVVLLAGRLRAAKGQVAEAEKHFRAAAVEQVPATAPAAELELAKLLIAVTRRTEAVPVLEHLILTYPQSALVPQARRLLDEARGAVPET